MRRLGFLITLAVLVSSIAFTATHVQVPNIRTLTGTDVCELRGKGRFTAPDNDCTPGARTGARLTRAVVCKHRDRARVPERLRDEIEASYGFKTNPDEFRGEIDHRVPHFLNGADTKSNLWPESGSIPNPKDKLETLAYTRVCSRGDLTPRQAVRWFTKDWRDAYTRYFGKP